MNISKGTRVGGLNPLPTSICNKLIKLKQDKEVGENSADNGDKGGFVHNKVVESCERGLLLYLRNS